MPLGQTMAKLSVRGKKALWLVAVICARSNGSVLIFIQYTPYQVIAWKLTPV
jgi:hypothetical protein